MPWEDLCRIALKKSIMASSPWLTHRFTHTQIAIANQGPGVLLYTNPWGWLLGPTSLTPNLKLETTSTPAGVDGRAGTGTARPGGKGQGKDGRKIQTASVRVRGECRWRDSCGMRKTSTDTAAAAEVDWAGQPASDAGQLESGTGPPAALGRQPMEGAGPHCQQPVQPAPEPPSASLASPPSPPTRVDHKTCPRCNSQAAPLRWWAARQGWWSCTLWNDNHGPQQAKIQSFEILVPQLRHNPKVMAAYYVMGGVTPVLGCCHRSQNKTKMSRRVHK